MSEARNRLTVMREIYNLTNDMARNQDNEDNLLSGVTERQQLMDEFDSLPDDLTPSELEVVRELAKSVMEKHSVLAESLEKFRNTAKQDLAKSNNNQKVLGYANKTIAASGSYMNYSR